jgi:molecular chaperone GrpE
MTATNDETHERPDDGEGSERPATEGAPADPIAQLAAERDELRDRLLRTAADFDNFRKRSRKDIEEALRTGRESVLREILPVIDNLERAAAAAESSESVGAVAEGVRMVLKSFEDTASRIGLERVKALGERFDPALHDAVQQVESADAEPGTILAEAQPGYRLGTRLLRAAMVVVAKKPQ